MSAPTVTVTATISDQNGGPVEGAIITMVMDRSEVYGGIIVKESVSGTTNASGVATLSVFPNALGSNGSQYKVTIVTPEQTIRSTAVVPNSNCNLHDIMQVPPYPAISLAQAATTAAQGYASAASASAANALTYRNSAEASATNATNSANAAAASALSASNDKATASNAAISATAAQSGAEAARDQAIANAAAIEIGIEPDQIPKNYMLGNLAYLDSDPAKVEGPASSVSGRIATFSGTSGKVVQDSGTAISDLVPATRTINGQALTNNITITSGLTPIETMFWAGGM